MSHNFRFAIQPALLSIYLSVCFVCVLTYSHKSIYHFKSCKHKYIHALPSLRLVMQMHQQYVAFVHTELVQGIPLPTVYLLSAYSSPSSPLIAQAFPASSHTTISMAVQLQAPPGPPSPTGYTEAAKAVEDSSQQALVHAVVQQGETTKEAWVLQATVAW